MKKSSIILARPSAWTILSEIKLSDLGIAANILKFWTWGLTCFTLDMYKVNVRENIKAVVAVANQVATNHILACLFTVSICKK